MKATVDIADRRFRRAKSLAAAEGMTVKELVAEAIEEKVSNGRTASEAPAAAWMTLNGVFAKTFDCHG